MARKPHIVANQQREARQQMHRAAPVIGSYPGIDEVRVELTFSDPEGKQQPSPRGLTYAGDMHAFFDFTCPLRDCEGGGFDANAELLRALGRRRSGHTGTMTCQGMRPRNGVKGLRCNLELRYVMSIRGKAAEAA
jgi:hypothetical protein